MTLPDRARVVVVGGGIVGCSVAFHLAERGWDDVVLLERGTLTSGTTWHAAGLVTQARATAGTREIVRRSISTFEELERRYQEGEGLSPGYRTTGTIHVATTADRWEELRRMGSVAAGSGQQVELVDPDRIVELFPPTSPAGMVGGLYYPTDGRGGASDSTMALAYWARQDGVRIVENCAAREVVTKARRAVAVSTDQGTIETEFVVNCTGMWGRQFAAGNDITLPLQALAHYYVVTDEIEGLQPHLPTLKSSDEFSYVKNEGGGLMVGFFEPGSTPWKPQGIPMDVNFPTLQEDWDHLGPFYEKMIERIPVLADAGVRLCFNGPESFTPDGGFHLGPVDNYDNYYAACGFNSIGFLSGPGAGEILAEWIIDGVPPVDLPEVGPRRATQHQMNRRYLEQRVVETLDKAYTIHWPFEQRETARGIRRTPLHDRLASTGAVFGEVAGWERANFYAQPGQAQTYDYSFGRPNWFGSWAVEHRGVRDSVGLFDLSSFGKILVQGSGALEVLQELSVSDIDIPIDKVQYTQWLNEAGGIEADVTITRTADSEFLVLTATGTLGRDLNQIQSRIGDRACFAIDVSSMYAMIPVMGPQARHLLQGLTDCDLSNEAFPFGASRKIDLGHTFVRATRVTFVGELGWELLVPVESAIHIYELLIDAGRQYDLIHAGYHALDSLRLEKGYRSWGHDIGPLDSPTQSGLGFTVAWDKPGGFVGHQAASDRRADMSRRLVAVSFDDPDIMAYHDEPVYRDGELVGQIVSVSYGHSLGRSVGLAWLQADETVDAGWLTAGQFEADVAMARTPLTVSLRAFYDPKRERVLA